MRGGRACTADKTEVATCDSTGLVVHEWGEQRRWLPVDAHTVKPNIDIIDERLEDHLQIPPLALAA
jgi:hypothetical protein